MFRQTLEILAGSAAVTSPGAQPVSKCFVSKLLTGERPLLGPGSVRYWDRGF